MEENKFLFFTKCVLQAAVLLAFCVEIIFLVSLFEVKDDYQIIAENIHERNEVTYAHK